MKQEKLNQILQRGVIVKMGELGKLLAEFDSLWDSTKQENTNEIIWTLNLNGESERENFSLKKIQYFMAYLELGGYKNKPDVKNDTLNIFKKGVEYA